MKNTPLVRLGLMAAILFILGAGLTFEMLFSYIQAPKGSTFALMIAGVMVTASGYALGMAVLHEKKHTNDLSGSLTIC